MKICIISSNFYPKITKMLIDGATKVLNKKKIKSFKIVNVPGTYEIPVVLSNLQNKYDGFIVLGCVIKGETPHFDFISKSVIDGIMNLSIEHKKPIGNGIITCLNRKQAFARQKKGQEAAAALLSVLNQVKRSTK